MQTFIKTLSIALAAVCSAVGVASGQSAPAPGPGTETTQRIMAALNTAKKLADGLNERHAALLEALKRAADAQQAQKVLDELMNSSKAALGRFDENSEAIKEITNLIAFVDGEKKKAEDELKRDPRWREILEGWKTRAGTLRELRQAFLKEVDRSNGFLQRLEKDQKFILQYIMLGHVDKAKQELDKALQELKSLGDALGAAIEIASKKEARTSGG